MAEKVQEVNEKQNVDPESIIVIGDRVDLVVQTGQVYRALIEDRIENGPFLIAVPTIKGIPMHAEQDEDIFLVFYRESGRYIAGMKVIGLEKRGEIRYMWLLQKTPAQKNQRREAYRLPISFTVQVYEYDEKVEQGLMNNDANYIEASIIEKAETRDLSVTGISITTSKQYQPNDMFILELHMAKTAAGHRAIRTKEKPLMLTATVKRSEPTQVQGRFATGLKFMGMTRSTSDELTQFVLNEQQRQIKMRRLSQ